MKNSTNWNLIVVYILTTILLSFISVSSYLSINNLVNNARMVDHTNKVLLNLENLFSEVKGAESGQRGYLLTHRNEFLLPYLGSYQRAIVICDTLEALVANNPEQLTQLNTLHELLEKRYGELQQQLDTDSGKLAKTSSRNTELAIQGSNTMLQIRKITILMERNERNILAQRNEDLRTSGNLVLSIITVFTITTFIILTLTFIRIRSELKRNEQINIALENSVNNLNRSNEELEQFAYVASHDLQEPLRKIRAFGDVLVSEYRDTLGETGRNYIQRMESAATRMQALISDLLNFSRASRIHSEPEAVNLYKLWQQVISDFETVIKDKQVDLIFEMDKDAEINGTKTLLGQLFQNLLSNAIKFSAKGEKQPQIYIMGRYLSDAEIEGRYYNESYNYFYEFKVSDNGIGFDEKYLDRIFIIFQRLHSRTAYDGTGIGLALCRKIVENHGGTITAQSQPGEGATFVVVMPVNKTENGNT